MIGMRDKEKKKNGRFEVALDHGFRKFSKVDPTNAIKTSIVGSFTSSIILVTLF